MNYDVHTMLILSVCFLWIFFIFFYFYKRGGQIFEPFNFYILTFSIYYPLGLVLHYVSYYCFDLYFLWFTPTKLIIEQSLDMLLLSFVFFSLFCFFWYVSSLFIRKINQDDLFLIKWHLEGSLDSNKFFLNFVFLIIGLSSLYVYFDAVGGFYLLSGAYGDSQSLKAGNGFIKSVSYVFTYASICYFSLCLLNYSSSVIIKICSFLLIVLFIFLFIIFTGERKSAIIFIVPFCLYYFFMGKIRLSTFFYLTPLLVALVIWSTLRDVLSTFNSLDDFTAYINSLDICKLILSSYLGSYSHLEPLANIVEYFPEKYEYQPLGFLFDSIYYYAPRSFFPDKPLALGPHAFISTIFLPGSNLTVVPTSLGEAYISGGLLVIPIYAFLHVLLFRFIEVLFWNKIKYSYMNLIVYSYLLLVPMFGIHRSGFFGFTTEFFSIFLLYIAVTVYSKFPKFVLKM